MNRVIAPRLALAVISALVGACNTGSQPVASMYWASGAIGSSGGTLTVTSSDAPESSHVVGTSIYIPPGALSSSVTITIGPPSSPSVAQAGQTAAGPVVELGPDGTKFASPVTITLPATLPAGTASTALAVEAVESDGSARTIPIQSYANGFTTFLTGTFTRFGCVTTQGSDGGSADAGVPACGGYEQPCCEGSACNSSLQCQSGVCAPGTVSGNDAGTPWDGGPSDAGSPPDAGGGANAASISFSCDCQNIDAFEHTSADMVIVCAASAQDATGAPVASSAIQFFAEAGRLVWSTDAEGREIVLYYPWQGGAAPEDVAPFAGEPRWTDSVTNVTHNPRDGLVTLIAYTEGGNTAAIGSANVPFNGDPFVDSNDNEQWDPGEPFVSTLPDGGYDPHNQTTYVWTQTKILWSGAPSSNPQVLTITSTPSQVNLDLGQSVTFTFQVVDDNLNALAANDPSIDTITFEGQGPGGGYLGFPQGELTTMVNTMGIKIDATNGYNIINPDELSSYLQDVDYSVEVQNEEIDGGGLAPVQYSINATCIHTGYLDEMGTDQDNDMEIIPPTNTQDPGGALYDSQ